MKRTLVVLLKIACVVASAVSFAAIGSAIAFLLTYYFIDGSEPENPGTDLGAGFAFLHLLFGLGSVSLLIGGAFASWLLFKAPAPPALTHEASR